MSERGAARVEIMSDSDSDQEMPELVPAEDAPHDPLHFVHPNDPAYVVLATRHTSEADAQRITKLGYPFLGTRGTRSIWRVPDGVQVTYSDTIPQLVTFGADFQVYAVIGMCVCCEYRWNAYKGGDWSRVLFPGDPLWDCAPPAPETLPKTEEMLAEERARNELYAHMRARDQYKPIMAFIDAVQGMGDEIMQRINVHAACNEFTDHVKHHKQEWL